MGVVYEAFDEKLGRRIALKCGKPGHGYRLSPEVRLATEVSHPNVCKIHEIHTEETPDGPMDFITMEFIEGETLSARIRREGRLPEKTARSIALQICAGLAEAHKRRVIHGDLKSSNVILAGGAQGEVRAVIADFGLARALDGSPVSGGSPGYMAPEVRRGDSTSVTADIYALGVILHEMTCGFRPDQRAVVAATTIAQAADTAVEAPERGERLLRPDDDPLPRLATKLDPVIRRCLQPDPAKRYQRVEEVAKALGPSKTRRALLAAGAVAILVAATAVTTYFRSIAPVETIKLRIDAIQAPTELNAQAAGITAGASQRIASLRSSEKTALAVASSIGRATHRLSGRIEDQKGLLKLQIQIQDLKSSAVLRQWSGEYRPEELRYAPVAVTGWVSATFHLPALPEYSSVNAAASQIYSAALPLLRRDPNIDEAAAAMERAAALDPDSALPHAGIAEVLRRKYFLTDDNTWLAKAQKELMRAEIRNPDSAEVHRIAGMIEWDANRRDEAIVRMRRATEFPSTNSDAFRRLGALYQNAGQYGEALQNYQKAAEIEPKFYRVHQDLGALYFTQANYPEAARAFQTAVQLAPDVPRLYAMLAESYIDQGKFQEAEAQLRESLRRGLPDPPNFELAHVLMYQRRDREAIGYLMKAATADLKSYLPWMYLGLARRNTGDVIESKRAFQKGMDLAQESVVRIPGSGNERAVLGYLAAQCGDKSRAEAEVAQALQLSPGHSNVIWMSALTYEVLRERERALEALHAAPRGLLEDMQRWPEAESLAADPRFKALLSTGPGGRS